MQRTPQWFLKAYRTGTMLQRFGLTKSRALGWLGDGRRDDSRVDPMPPGLPVLSSLTLASRINQLCGGGEALGYESPGFDVSGLRLRARQCC